TFQAPSLGCPCGAALVDLFCLAVVSPDGPALLPRRSLPHGARTVGVAGEAAVSAGNRQSPGPLPDRALLAVCRFRIHWAVCGRHAGWHRDRLGLWRRSRTSLADSGPGRHDILDPLAADLLF